MDFTFCFRIQCRFLLSASSSDLSNLPLLSCSALVTEMSWGIWDNPLQIFWQLGARQSHWQGIIQHFLLLLILEDYWPAAQPIKGYFFIAFTVHLERLRGVKAVLWFRLQSKWNVNWGNFTIKGVLHKDQFRPSGLIRFSFLINLFLLSHTVRIKSNLSELTGSSQLQKKDIFWLHTLEFSTFLTAGRQMRMHIFNDMHSVFSFLMIM